jgi:hypothetical protein
MKNDIEFAFREQELSNLTKEEISKTFFKEQNLGDEGSTWNKNGKLGGKSKAKRKKKVRMNAPVPRDAAVHLPQCK